MRARYSGNTFFLNVAVAERKVLFVGFAALKEGACAGMRIHM
jgi:hypothetical protein